MTPTRRTCVTLGERVLTVNCVICGVRLSPRIHIVQGVYYCPKCCPECGAEEEFILE